MGRRPARMILSISAAGILTKRPTLTVTIRRSSIQRRTHELLMFSAAANSSALSKRFSLLILPPAVTLDEGLRGGKMERNGVGFSTCRKIARLFYRRQAGSIPYFLSAFCKSFTACLIRSAHAWSWWSAPHGQSLMAIWRHDAFPAIFISSAVTARTRTLGGRPGPVRLAAWMELSVSSKENPCWIKYWPHSPGGVGTIRGLSPK